MSKLQENKTKLRALIASQKKSYSPGQLLSMSAEVMTTLEITGAFAEAKTIFIYNSMGDEVHTRALIDKWQHEKDFYVPVINGDDLLFRKYTQSADFMQSALGIFEPQGEDFTDYKSVDLIIVPGLAFDRKKNRMGRGKGYYDRFLKKVSAPKIGICFDFQLRDDVPVGAEDIGMDMVVSENDLIW